MTVQEWRQVAEDLRRRWPGSKLWEAPTELYQDFQYFDMADVKRAVVSLFNEGRQSAPAPSVLNSRIREQIGERMREVARRSGGEHRHVWGIWSEDEESGKRLGVCAIGDECGHTERWFSKGALLTDGELEEQRKAKELGYEHAR